MIKQILLMVYNVAVFDEHDRQMPQLQGAYSDVVESLRREDLSEAEIYVPESLSMTGRATPEEFLSYEVSVDGRVLRRPSQFLEPRGRTAEDDSRNSGEGAGS